MRRLAQGSLDAGAQLHKLRLHLRRARRTVQEAECETNRTLSCRCLLAQPSPPERISLSAILAWESLQPVHLQRPLPPLLLGAVRAVQQVVQALHLRTQAGLHRWQIGTAFGEAAAGQAQQAQQTVGPQCIRCAQRSGVVSRSKQAARRRTSTACASASCSSWARSNSSSACSSQSF